MRGLQKRNTTHVSYGKSRIDFKA